MAINTNRVSLVIPQTAIDTAMGFFKQGFDTLKPFLIEALSKEESDALAKVGDKSEPYVLDGIALGKANPNLVPRKCDIAEAEKDFSVYEALQAPDVLISQISQAINSTKVIAGAEALDCINKFYTSVKNDAEDGVADAIPVYDVLKVRYAANGRRITKADVTK
ncbi:MAG: hypothetical protein QM541_02420 [Flavobacterium sp.]|nr:hypothetical protein [Flavobacterium sp.]